MNVYLVHGRGWRTDKYFLLGVYSTALLAQAVADALRTDAKGALPEWETGVYNVEVVPMTMNGTHGICINPPLQEVTP